jgi:hypothetical protein
MGPESEQHGVGQAEEEEEWHLTSGGLGSALGGREENGGQHEGQSRAEDGN